MAATTLGAGALGTCPHCGEPLAAASGSPSTDRPLQECAKCGRVVLRSSANEWGLLSGSQKLAIVSRHALVVLAVGLALPLVQSAVVLGKGQPWQLYDSLLWLGIGLGLAGIFQGGRLMTRIRHSRRRMRDPMYLAKLVQNQIAQAARR